MEKQFIRVVLVTFYFIFLENNALLTSHGMVGDSFEANDGNTLRKMSTTTRHEFFKTKFMKKVERTSTCSPIVQNYSESSIFISKGSRQDKVTNEIHDKDYSGDVEMESTIASMVFMERKMTMTPLTVNQQYSSDDKETDTGAHKEYKATLKPFKNSEILGDLHSTVASDFEFSGYFQLETSTNVEPSDDFSQDFIFERSGAESSGEEDYYFVPNLKGFNTDLELDFGGRSAKHELPSQSINVEETQVSTSPFFSANELLLDLQDLNKTVSGSEGVSVSSVENSSYISAVAKDAGNYKKISILPKKFDRGRSIVSRVLNDDTKLLSMASAAMKHRRSNAPKRPITLPSNRISSTSAVNEKRYTASPVVVVTIPFSRSSSVSAVKLEKYGVSRVPNAMASNFPRQIDSGKILLSHNETMVNAVPDNALQDLYLQNSDKASQKSLGYSNVPEGRAATVFKKRSTSYSSQYSRPDDHIDEQKSRTVFISISPPKVQTSTKNNALQNDVEISFNSTANELSTKLLYSHQKLLTGMVCSAIFILLLAVITVLFIRGYRHRKNCCTRTGTSVVESRREDPSIPLSEVITHGRIDPPKMEHLSVNGEEECNV